MLWYLCRRLVGISITFYKYRSGDTRAWKVYTGTKHGLWASWFSSLSLSHRTLHFLVVKEKPEEKEMKQLLVAVISHEKLEWYCLFL